MKNFMVNFLKKSSINAEVVKILRKEQNKLLPTGQIYCARGSGKHYLSMTRTITYFVYACYCQWCEQTDEVVTLERAHRDIQNCIAQLWNEVYQE